MLKHQGDSTEERKAGELALLGGFVSEHKACLYNKMGFLKQEGLWNVPRQVEKASS